MPQFHTTHIEATTPQQAFKQSQEQYPFTHSHRFIQAELTSDNPYHNHHNATKGRRGVTSVTYIGKNYSSNLNCYQISIINS